MVSARHSWDRRSQRRLWLLSGVLALAFMLRVYDLGAVPLRGDEAFAVRYWADDPARGIPFLIDEGEPHPFGTYLAFWAWKNLAGDSEFAMRVLPLLGSLIGAASTTALARRLFRSESVALCAALLWAINPFQIWHAQDVRNYALWAGLSPLSMWLFVRMIDSQRPSRVWLLYLLAEALALYTFFLEACMLLVQFAYLLIVRRTRVTVRRVTAAWTVLLIILIPWFWQLWMLARIGYEGNAEAAVPLRLLTRFLPTLLVGPESATWPALAALGWLAALILVLVWRYHERAGEFNTRILWLVAWLLIPIGLLLVAATRTTVFHPRYVIASAPPLLMLVALALQPLKTARLWGQHGAILLLMGVVIIAPVAGLPRLAKYYRHTDPKAPDWPALVTYLDSRIPPAGPHLVLHTLADPAFAHYYRGHADEKSLVPNQPVTGQIFSDTLYYRSIWLVGRSAEAEAFLQDHMQRVSVSQLSDFYITQYRSWQTRTDEIANAAHLTFGDTARLQGYTLQGPDSASSAITLLLYWEPLAQSEVSYQVFVHLLGPVNPATGTPLWDQDDHEPLNGFARTTTWETGTLLRDPYNLLDNPGQPVPPAGAYQIAVGLYDPATNTRLPVTDSDGAPLGDSAILQTINLP